MTDRMLSKPVLPPPGKLHVWRYHRDIDDAILFSDTYPEIDPSEKDDCTTPELIEVDPAWYAALPEDPGP